MVNLLLEFVDGGGGGGGWKGGVGRHANERKQCGRARIPSFARRSCCRVDGRGGEGGRTHEFTRDDANERGGGGREDRCCTAASDSMNMLRSHKRHALDDCHHEAAGG